MQKLILVAALSLFSIAGGLVIPWATCFIFIQTTEELLRPDYGEMSETFRQFHSGLPFHFVLRSDISVGGSIIWKFYWIDVVIWTVTLAFLLSISFIGLRATWRRLFSHSHNTAEQGAAANP